MKGIFKFLWHAGATIFWLCAMLYIGAFSIGMLMATACSYKSLSPFTKNKTGQLIRLKGRPDQINYTLSWKSNEELVISGFDFNKMMAFENQSWGSRLPSVYFEIDSP